MFGDLTADHLLHWLVSQALQLMTAGGGSSGPQRSAAFDAYKSEDAALAAQVTVQLHISPCWRPSRSTAPGPRVCLMMNAQCAPLLFCR